MEKDKEVAEPDQELSCPCDIDCEEEESHDGSEDSEVASSSSFLTDESSEEVEEPEDTGLPWSKEKRLEFIRSLIDREAGIFDREQGARLWKDSDGRPLASEDNYPVDKFFRDIEGLLEIGMREWLRRREETRHVAGYVFRRNNELD